ncbi:hypothetical protein AA103193_3039 [Tanticharoenia sakaeratensis NBRC 103193]|nr:hypothetical protein AA103193_3039 [Tanticharoenia sakaeratensis NBRC 103193]
MHVEQRTGQVPGTIYATVRHGNTHRTIRVDVERTNAGRFVAKMPDDRWSPECMTVDNAILLHAAVAFPIEVETAPWLANPRPASRFSFVEKNRAVRSPEPAATEVSAARPCVSLERA